MRQDPNLIDPRGPWILTHTGVQFVLTNPTPEMVRFDDIAHALSRINRFTGHGRRFYSVAEHSVAVMRRVAELGGDRDEQRAALLHDAAEAYVGDASSPLKAAMRRVQAGRVYPAIESDYDILEARAHRVVSHRFGLRWVVPTIVKRADLELVAIEGEHLLGPLPAGWGPPNVLVSDYRPRCWPSEYAEMEFRDAWDQLG